MKQEYLKVGHKALKLIWTSVAAPYDELLPRFRSVRALLNLERTHLTVGFFVSGAYITPS